MGLCCGTGSRYVAAGVVVRQARELMEGWALSIQAEQAPVNSVTRGISLTWVRPVAHQRTVICIGPGRGCFPPSGRRVGGALPGFGNWSTPGAGVRECGNAVMIGDANCRSWKCSAEPLRL